MVEVPLAGTEGKFAGRASLYSLAKGIVNARVPRASIVAYPAGRPPMNGKLFAEFEGLSPLDRSDAYFTPDWHNSDIFLTDPWTSFVQ
jgi:hypothetical protein